MGDLPFTVYFDFERTTGDSILHGPKMFVISYCQIYSFHPDLKLDKHCVKSVQIRSLFFFFLVRIFPHLDWIWRDTSYLVVVLLDKCVDRTISSSNIDDIDTLKRFFNEYLVDYDDFPEVYEAIDDFKVIEKYGDYGRKKKCLYQQNNWLHLCKYNEI